MIQKKNMFMKEDDWGETMKWDERDKRRSIVRIHVELLLYMGDK